MIYYNAKEFPIGPASIIILFLDGAKKTTPKPIVLCCNNDSDFIARKYLKGKSRSEFFASVFQWSICIFITNRCISHVLLRWKEFSVALFCVDGSAQRKCTDFSRFEINKDALKKVAQIKKRTDTNIDGRCRLLTHYFCSDFVYCFIGDVEISKRAA